MKIKAMGLTLPAAAAAIAFAPFVAPVLAPVATAAPGPCATYPMNLQACEDCTAAHQVTADYARVCVGTEWHQSPDCSRYQLPTDRGACEDRQAAGLS